MSRTYRVKFKKGDLEFEVESHDREYVAEVLSQLGSASLLCQTSMIAESPLAVRWITDREGTVAGFNARKVRDAIRSSNEIAAIEAHILNANNQLGRVLLAFWGSEKCGYKTIGTGDVARITKMLGSSVSQPNAAKVMAKHSPFFSVNGTIRKGARTPYSLTLKGRRAFAKLLKGAKGPKRP